MRAALYLSRRLEWRGASWSRKLDFAVAAAALYRDHGALLKRNSSFAGKHSGRRAFVVGNGPSLNSQDLAPLGSELTFVSNAFFKHPVLAEWKPSYYFLTDPLYFDGSEASSQVFQELVGAVGSTVYFLPASALEVVREQTLLNEDEAFYVGMVGDLAHDPAWSPDLTKALPGVRTVVQLGIIAAMYMGCSPIYLLGMDHDWLAHKGEQQNFYQGRSMGSEGTLDDWRYQDLMEAVLTMWRGYRSIRRVAESMNIRIVNASQGGFLDVFERGDYESVIKPRAQ